MRQPLGRALVATLGFQGSVCRVGNKPVPQYFVMIGGGVTDTGATFARLAAKIPARRMPEVVERLIALYQRERMGHEEAAEFFQRIDVETVGRELADLRVSERDITPLDYVDLGETGEFAPEVMDGECSA